MKSREKNSDFKQLESVTFGSKFRNEIDIIQCFSFNCSNFFSAYPIFQCIPHFTVKDLFYSAHPSFTVNSLFYSAYPIILRCMFYFTVYNLFYSAYPILQCIPYFIVHSAYPILQWIPYFTVNTLFYSVYLILHTIFYFACPIL